MLRVRVWAAAVVFVALGSCGAREADLGPVTTREQALAIAKAQLGEATIRGRPLEVTRDGDRWTVRVVHQTAKFSATTIFIDAKTGRTKTHAEQVVDVAVPRNSPRAS